MSPHHAIGSGAPTARAHLSEAVGGAILLAAATVAMIWANTPWSESYTRLAQFVPFDVPLLDLSLAGWAADGLLAIFFFVVGIELKRELVAGSLSNPRRAVLPIAAAVGGMVVPALVYTVIVGIAGERSSLAGWAVPVATDIAFALAVLAVVATHLPPALRVFLLTLAVVDDLLAIMIIAVVYTRDLQPLLLVAALAPLAVFAALARRGITSGWLLVPLALTTWVCVHESGVHATVAGVLLGLVLPVARPGSGQRCVATSLEHRWRPLSMAVAVPVFAFFGAGLDLRDGGLGDVVTDVTSLAVIAGLVVGKPLGVFASAWLVARLTHAELDDGIEWLDVLAVALLSGIGFTVALLIGELAFAGDAQVIEQARGGILVGSVTAAALASVVLVARDRHYRQLAGRSTRAVEGDLMPDAGSSARISSTDCPRETRR